MLDLQTYAKQRGISVDTVRRRIKLGELKAIKDGTKLYIPEESEKDKESPGLSEAALKRLKLALQIKQAQQDLNESIFKNFLQWNECFRESGIDAFSKFSAVVTSLKLSIETCEIINKALEECIIQTSENTSRALQKRLFEQE